MHWGGGGGGSSSQCACVVAPPPFDPFKPLEWAHARAHTPLFPPSPQSKPQPRLLKVHLASPSPLQLQSPQLEAMNQLVTLSFYSARFAPTTSCRKFRGVCPLRWAAGRRGWFSGRTFGGADVSRGSRTQCWSLFLDGDNERHAHTSCRAAVCKQLS